MNRESHCRCLLCGMERRLTKQFAGPEGQNAYRQLTTFSPVLSAFPAASDLISFLHTEQSAANGNPSKDSILAELLRTTTNNDKSFTSRELLLLAFVPMMHGISRQVVTRCPALLPDDVAQHVVTAFLESLRSHEFAGRDSHLAFAIARFMRRNAFAWAGRESHSKGHGSDVDVIDLEHAPHRNDAHAIERAAVLRHFLDRCRQRGILSGEDLELLIQFTLGELPSADYSNASRQRMKRLIGKLRRAANRPRRPKFDDRQLRLF
jgi:hypothetical protein